MRIAFAIKYSSNHCTIQGKELDYRIKQLYDYRIGSCWLKFRFVSFYPNKRNLFTLLVTGLAGAHQKQNASMAIALANSFLQTSLRTSAEDKLISESFKRGLVQTKWPGRCQTLQDPKRTNLTWYLDGAHTLESLDCCIQWFVTPGVGLSTVPATSTTK